ncbi:MAG TPA: 23S rRNA (adenine(2503)-C(2))-methyltransferase RlmN [Pirellulaceae bacterium]|nr:23S rRNA (adenine(2503)-C(2))-methyltransferase RlmN [Pirellulaceae bacterium]
MLDLYAYSQPQLQALLAKWSCSAVDARRLWRYLYVDGVTLPAEMLELSPRLRDKLTGETLVTHFRQQRETQSDDGQTQKYLLKLHDGEAIETVLMRPRGRNTACLSSQAGCAWGCVFCATGQAGLQRHLSASEIVAQAMFIDRVLRATHHETAPTRGTRRSPRSRLRNLVLMGMGEPLHNYDAVMHALIILHDAAGLALAAKHITISTVGIVPGIIRMADEALPYSLAVSLHAASQDERAAMLPVAKAWPLPELLAACRYYCTKLDRKIFLEWTLIAGTNDTPAHALELAKLLGDLPAQVNLIPLNPIAGYAGERGNEAAAQQFRAVLLAHGVPSTVRQRRGVEIAAGCGQLAGSESPHR